MKEIEQESVFRSGDITVTVARAGLDRRWVVCGIAQEDYTPEEAATLAAVILRAARHAEQLNMETGQ